MYVYANIGVIYVNASAGQVIDFLNTVGQKLQLVVATEGLNSICYDTAGVVIIKVGVTVVKVQM